MKRKESLLNRSFYFLLQPFKLSSTGLSSEEMEEGCSLFPRQTRSPSDLTFLLDQQPLNVLLSGWTRDESHPCILAKATLALGPDEPWVCLGSWLLRSALSVSHLMDTWKTISLVSISKWRGCYRKWETSSISLPTAMRGSKTTDHRHFPQTRHASISTVFRARMTITAAFSSHDPNSRYHPPLSLSF